VIVGLMTPVRAWYGPDLFAEKAELIAQSMRKGVESEQVLFSRLEEVKEASREAVSPVERLQHRLHGWVAYGIMPLFAFANSGVPLGNASFEGASYYAFLGIIGGLVFGKLIGILSFSWLAAKAGLALLPRGVRWPHVAVIGLVGGIGFTMSLFVSALAFPNNGALLETAKLAILCGSGVAALLTMLVGRLLLPAQLSKEAAASEAEAEASTEV
jgi:NhaA family Na+:H+ antiporter